MADFDLVVLGSGPAGEQGAVQAARLGKRVVMVREPVLGGTAANTGPLPSKTLRETALYLSVERHLRRAVPAQGLGAASAARGLSETA